MGLDDVELFMDLEDIFHIPFEPSDEFKGQVSYLIEYYKERFTLVYFEDLKKKVIEYKFKDPDAISRDEYNRFALCMGWPKAHWFNPRRNPGCHKLIISNLFDGINKVDLKMCVSEKVKAAIINRLDYKGVLLESHNIYKDLGAG